MKEARHRGYLLYVSIYVIFKTVGTEKKSVMPKTEGRWGGN